MTFKGMLKILVNDYRKRHQESFHSVVSELMETRRELRDVKEKLRILQLSIKSPPSDTAVTTPTISLFIQYYGFFNLLCDICRTMTVRELQDKLRQVTGTPTDQPLHIRVLSEDGLTTLFFLDNEPDRTLNFYHDRLKPRMILSIEDNDGENDNDNDEQNHSESTKSTSSSSNRAFSFDESSV